MALDKQILLSFIDKLNKKYPNMQLEFYANANPQILEKLLDYKLDSTHNKFLASYEKER
ncbi:MAG: hypothetical protein RBR70_08735 [Arcobacter sp.]|uniref:hypothetical protein n=1 Tax=Arcobacter sp. TaxID=1872629 RepID=UPI002A764C0A|nr:hypothetical protein [Arcobacter sp.]MDY3205142.1 hypothetical protein [Arcobacter sp.]